LSEIAPRFSRFLTSISGILWAGGEMPIVKSTNGEVAFALAIVKASVIADRQESSRIEAALQVMFPGVAVILVVEDDELATYQRRRELSDFSKRSACQVISSSRISAN
jgi:hypothetical protein